MENLDSKYLCLKSTKKLKLFWAQHIVNRQIYRDLLGYKLSQFWIFISMKAGVYQTTGFVVDVGINTDMLQQECELV